MKRIKNYVSSFKGISPNAYAERINVTHECQMSSLQEAAYNLSMKTVCKDNDIQIDFDRFSQAFLSAPRMASNCVYPGGKFGTKGRPQPDVLKRYFKHFLKDYSTKFHNCLKNLNQYGPHFVYSNFVAAGGTEDFAIALKQHGYSEFGTSSSSGLKYGVFRTGKDDENKKMVETFNHPDNKDGSMIKLIIGSPAMKEGVSLKRVRHIHLLDLHWNKSRMEQVIARGIRFCSQAKNIPNPSKNP